MKDQVNSPLELYERAYRLQYDENKIPEACRLYKTIIDEFPESNECGYAVIQLEKVLSSSVSERIIVSSRWSGIASTLSLIVSLAVLLFIIIFGSIYIKSVNSRLSCISMVSQAIVKLQLGKDKEALELLNNAKSAGNKDMTPYLPYLISADLLLKKQQYSKAMAEIETIKKVSGAETLAAQEMARAKSEEISGKSAPAADTPAIQKIEEEPAPVKEKVEPQPKPKPKKESVAPPRPSKHKSVAPTHQDSVSFF